MSSEAATNTKKKKTVSKSKVTTSLTQSDPCMASAICATPTTAATPAISNSCGGSGSFANIATSAVGALSSAMHGAAATTTTTTATTTIAGNGAVVGSGVGERKEGVVDLATLKSFVGSFPSPRRSAAVSLVTNAFGLIIGVVLYLNYLLLQPFIEPLMWAVILSIPLHAVKTQLQAKLAALPDDSGINTLVSNMATAPYWFIFGPVHDIIHALLRCYRAIPFVLNAFKNPSVKGAINRGLFWRIYSVWKQIMEFISPEDSATYFRYLFWSFRLYLAISVMEMLGMQVVMVIAGIVVVFAFMKGFTALCLSMIKLVFRKVNRLLKGIPAAVLGGLLWAVTYFPRKIGGRTVHFLKENTAMVSSWAIILVFFLGAFVASFFCLYQIGSETSTLVSTSVQLIEKTLPKEVGEQFSSLVQSGLEQGVQMGRGWVDQQISAVYPEANSTYLMDTVSEYTTGIYHRFMSNSTMANETKLFDLPPKTAEIVDLLSNSSVREAVKAVPAVFYELKGLAKDHVEKLSALRDTFLGETDVMEYAQTFGAAALSSGTAAIGTAFSVVQSVSSSLMAGFETLMQFFLFFTALFELLQADRTCLSVFSIFGSQDLVDSMEEVMSAVFISTSKLFVFHSIFSWLLFGAMGVHLHYILALLSGLFAVLPLFDPLYICFIGALQLFLQGKRIMAVLLVVIHYYVSGGVDGLIVDEIPGTHSMLVGISMVMGFEAFGSRGVFVGPLIFSLPVIAYNYLQRQTKKKKSKDKDKKKEDDHKEEPKEEAKEENEAPKQEQEESKKDK
ncbi:Transmembrane protein [Pelomyxa schiedti]|nr:Transmembrane protein [Pelomyxa schiedti]